MWRILILAILDLWGISFHGVVVYGLGKDLLFEYVLGRCEEQLMFFDNIPQYCIV